MFKRLGIQFANSPVLNDARKPNDPRHELWNEEVRFRIQDVYVPEPTQILADLHGEDMLQGRVIDLSDRGSEREAFAVVEVHGLTYAVVVPVAKVGGVKELRQK